MFKSTHRKRILELEDEYLGGLFLKNKQIDKYIANGLPNISKTGLNLTK